MKYEVVAETYARIEATSKRLEMTDLLVEILETTPADIVDKVIYLTQGKIYPDFVGLEVGVAEKLAVKVLAKASGRRESEVVKELRKTGDIGEAAGISMANKRQATFFKQPLTVERVYETLDKVAKASGSGSLDLKISLLAGLLGDAGPSEAKYLMRTVTGNLRLGIADMTMLDALALAYGGGKEARQSVERAYNISSDLGMVARVIASQGVEGVEYFKVSVGRPVRSMLAERLSSPEEILEKLGGECIAEYKYDGERMQVHVSSESTALFSRRLENITDQFPDVVQLLEKHVRASEAILETECVAVDPNTGEMLPFQELMHRRRKYGIHKAIEDYPAALFVFDALYIDGDDLTLKPYPVRRDALERTVKEGERVKLAQQKVTRSVKELEEFFRESIADGCEGLICKSMSVDSVYQAGARGWLWIKYKRDYKSEMTDTVDLAVVGAFHGRGRRAQTYGALLLASYNPEGDTFETVTKCGTGFTDEDLASLPKTLEKHRLSHKHPRVQSAIEAEIWFEPALVLEVLGAEITLSPIHVCAINAVREGAGLAVRFPRFTGKYRLDKSAEDATTSNEILKMYRSQLKKMDET